MLNLKPSIQLKHSGILISSRQASHSPGSWLDRQRNDVYTKMSRYDNYRARSAYKLIQIDDKYKFLKPGKIVIEAGAAPGSWTQVICRRLQLHEKQNKLARTGMCIAIDKAAIEPVDGAICIGNADFTSPFTQAKLLTWLDGRQADCVLSDMAPNTTGQKYLNHSLIMALVNQFVNFSMQVLKPGGVLLAKIFAGEESNDLKLKLESSFRSVKFVKPQASFGDSTEMYMIAVGRLESRPGQEEQKIDLNKDGH